MISAYLISLFIIIGITVIEALAMQLVMGFTGMLNLGHTAFYCIGAYVSALLAIAGYPYWVCLIFAGLAAMIAGFLLALPTNKIKGDYFVLATMSFTFVVYAVVLNWGGLTNGPMGLPGIPRPEVSGIKFSDNFNFFILTAAIALISYLVIKRIAVSPFGRVLEAVRDNELSAKVLGKNTFKTKILALVISAFFIGMAGSIVAHFITFIDPSQFTIMEIIPILCAVIIGGLGSLEGTIIATIILILLPEPLRFIGFPASIIGPARQMIYALALILILIYKPNGFFGKIKSD